MRLMSKLGWLGVSGNMWSEDWDLEALFSEELIDSKNFCSFCYISAILFSPRLGIFHIELFSTTWRNLATVLQPPRIKGLCSLAERWSSERGISSREVILPALYDFHVILTERRGCWSCLFLLHPDFLTLHSYPRPRGLCCSWRIRDPGKTKGAVLRLPFSVIA